MRPTHPELSHPYYRGVQLSETDASAGLELSTEAGWNQTASDWRFMLREGLGFGFETTTGRLVASAVLLPYGNCFAWISMVLVSAIARRQRLATLLLRHALDTGLRRGERLLLDATEDGRQVYLPLGFRDLRTITRWTRAASVRHESAAPADITPIVAAERWAAWDEVRFGAGRSELLLALHSAAPNQSWEFGRPLAARAGFCLTRAGRSATQLGPIVATDELVASTLLAAALDETVGACVVDVLDGRPRLETLLRQHGLSPGRRFIRMIHGAGAEPGLPDQIFAITGPEFG